ncbi:Putative multidrug resistance protein MdtD [Streptomyces fumanus]
MGSTRPATPDTVRPAGPARRGPVVAALMLAMALAALDSTIVSTAVPQIVGDLGGFSVFSWLFSGYLLAVTVTLPVYGKLSDTFGRKPVLVAGAVLFLLGSLLCALAWNMGALIAFRIVQGLGGGALQGTVQTLAADLYPLKERPKIQARLSTVWALSAVAGPGLGGVLAAYADWRWIFLVNLPVGAVALWLIVRHLHEPGREAAGPRAPVDWAGALAVFGCGGALLTALVQGGVAWPWWSAPSLTLFGTGLVLLVAVVVIERRAADPIMPGWVWRRRTIAAVNLALGALGLLMVAPTVFLPTYAQSVLGLAPVAAGFVLSVWTLSWPVSAALSQHVYRRIGFRDTALLGIGTATLILLRRRRQRGAGRAARRRGRPGRGDPRAGLRHGRSSPFQPRDRRRGARRLPGRRPERRTATPRRHLAIALYERTARRRVDPLADRIRAESAGDAHREAGR